MPQAELAEPTPFADATTRAELLALLADHYPGAIALGLLKLRTALRTREEVSAEPSLADHERRHGGEQERAATNGSLAWTLFRAVAS